jgi:enoyl-CoA hydratase/carnithine racemase
MERELVLWDVAEQIGTLTLNHPEKRNALSVAMLQALTERLARVAGDRGVRVVILRAAGPVFSAGHDLRELAAADERAVAATFALCTEVMESLRRLPQPVIAQVHALATAAGCQLVASCDLVVAAEGASFATPGVKVGLFCSTPAVPLARAVPQKKAMEMLLTGEAVTAREAERLGLVNRVAPPDRLAEETWNLARQIARASPAVIALGKRAFYEQAPLPYPDAYAHAQRAIVENACLPQAKEGFTAFLEKRPPRWPD